MGKMIKCWICGKEHDYCPNCGQTYAWKYIADVREHYLIHMTIEEYRSGSITKEEAIDKFAEKCGVHANDDLSWMLPHVEKGVRDIIGEKVKLSRTPKTLKNTETKPKLFS